MDFLQALFESSFHLRYIVRKYLGEVRLDHIAVLKFILHLQLDLVKLLLLLLKLVILDIHIFLNKLGQRLVVLQRLHLIDRAIQRVFF
jgi:hypothetical protein